MHGEEFCGHGAAHSTWVAFSNPWPTVAASERHIAPWLPLSIRGRPHCAYHAVRTGQAVHPFYAYPLGLQNVLIMCSTIWVRELAIDFYCELSFPVVAKGFWGYIYVPGFTGGPWGSPSLDGSRVAGCGRGVGWVPLWPVLGFGLGGARPGPKAAPLLCSPLRGSAVGTQWPR